MITKILIVFGCIIFSIVVGMLFDWIRCLGKSSDDTITPRLDKLANKIFDDYRKEHPEVVEAHRKISERNKR